MKYRLAKVIVKCHFTKRTCNLPLLMDLLCDVTRGIYSNTRMKIGCVYSTLIEIHLRIIDLIKKSKTNEVILLYLQREFGCTWSELEVFKFIFIE